MASPKQKQILAKKQANTKLVNTKLRKDDTVKVITGRDKGKTGKILEVNRVKGTAVVEGVMMVKRHTKPNPQQQIKGGIAEREAPIALSNIMLMTPDGKTTKAGFKMEGSRRVRFARRTGELLDKGGK